MKVIVDMDRMTLKKTSGEAPSPFWDSFVLPLLRYRQMTYTVVGVTVAVALLYCLIIPNQYTSTATILPTSANDQLSELKDLAAGSLGELGLGSMMQAQENSSALYPRVLTSRLISENVLRRSYEFTDGDEEIVCAGHGTPHVEHGRKRHVLAVTVSVIIGQPTRDADERRCTRI